MSRALQSFISTTPKMWSSAVSTLMGSPMEFPGPIKHACSDHEHGDESVTTVVKRGRVMRNLGKDCETCRDLLSQYLWSMNGCRGSWEKCSAMCGVFWTQFMTIRGLANSQFRPAHLPGPPTMSMDNAHCVPHVAPTFNAIITNSCTSFVNNL